MKTLTLLRHAKSDWDDPDQRDFDRALNPRGKRAAETVGRHLRSLGWTFDAVFASPAERVRETLDLLSLGYGERLRPHWERRIYLASAPGLMDVLGDVPDDPASVLLAGHNPGLEDLVLTLAADGEGTAEVEEKFPTASVARLILDVDGWADLADGCGRLESFVRPRDLDATLGPDTK